MGAGRWGVNVVRTLAATEGADLIWVADPDPVARERAQRVSSRIVTCESVETTLGDVEAIAVCTPSVDHFEHARHLLGEGKHLLVEKPMSTRTTESEQLDRSADRAGLTLMVGHQLLFHPLFRRLADLVARDVLGPLRCLRGLRTGIVDFDREPDVLWAYAPHDVSLILALAGESPAVVRASGRLDSGCTVVEAAEIELEFTGGLRAEIALDGTTGERERLLTVIGERATAIFDDSLPGGRLTVHDRLGDSVDEAAREPDQSRATEPLALECHHFVECVRRGARPLTHGRHAVDVVRVVENIATLVDTGHSGRRSA
jgi:UDP-2-acetamido-3-amino-2,3-dideoxy-glucuronate N-acetyltransferase